MTFGVSPAWFLSLFGEGFTLRQAAESLVKIRELGFTGWQPEIFREEAIPEWKSGDAAGLRARSRSLGLRTDVFVAHFLGTYFTDEHALARDDGLQKLEQVLAVLDAWEEIRVVVVPLPAYTGRPAHKDISRGRLAAFAGAVESSGRILAVEPMPGSLAGNSSGIAELLSKDGLARVGVNYDSGHFHAAGESPETVFSRLGERIVCTHLCDNDGITNLSLAPGDGTVPWEAAVGGLEQLGYRGPWDIEIRCTAESAEESYLRGRKFIEEHRLRESE